MHTRAIWDYDMVYQALQEDQVVFQLGRQGMSDFWPVTIHIPYMRSLDRPRLTNQPSRVWHFAPSLNSKELMFNDSTM